jgi:cell division protein FtsW
MRREGLRKRPLSVVDATNSPRRHRPDYVLLILSAVLLVIGLITIYAISPGLSASTGTSSTYYVSKQLLAIALGVVCFLVTALLPLEVWRKHIKVLVIISFLAALAVRAVGQKVNGAYRWVQIGGFSFQAVELIKFTLLIWLASFLAIRIKENTIAISKYTLKPLIVLLLLIGIVVAGIESDLGSTGVMIIMISTMCFIAGLPMRKVAVIASIVLVGLILLVSTSSYREQRVFTFLHPTQNCQTTGSGYQACQALIAVGSGGLFGKGLGRGVQDYGYLPETDNDSIFAVYAEQFGFIGTALLICVFVAFFKRFKNIMEKAPDMFTKLIVAGVLAWISSQALINVGAMIGLLPLKGITLPLISYGGTSIVFVMAAIGLVFNISHYTTSRVVDEPETVGGNSSENTALRRRNGRPRYAYSGRSTSA